MQKHHVFDSEQLRSESTGRIDLKLFLGNNEMGFWVFFGQNLIVNSDL